jgi:hypothetical protein
MSRKLEVSFNSPQCGWMSIGFDDGVNEYHTTTAYTPYATALSDILRGLTGLLDPAHPEDELVIPWSRNPEEFDFKFRRDGEEVQFEVIEYPSIRTDGKGETVFLHRGNVVDFCKAFYGTFEQLWQDRDTDEFEENWRQPFPYEEFETFKKSTEMRGDLRD